MGKFKDVGSPSLVLMEELAEAIQVIAKKHRFNGEWDEIPEGKTETRWEELESEMDDIIYQWNRLVIQRHQEQEDGNSPITDEVWGRLVNMNKNSN